MYRKQEQSPNTPENFELTFEGQLSENNRWVIMAQLIPWSEFEEEYASLFSEEMGAPAKTFRMALASLIIKEKLGISDRETVEQIRENPYLQYFIGLSSYSNDSPFDASMLSHFRQRINIDIVNKINQLIVSQNEEKTQSEPEKKNAEKAEEVELSNRGKLTSTSSTSIAINFLVMNLSTLLKEALCLFLCLFFVKRLFFGSMIMKNYALTSSR